VNESVVVFGRSSRLVGVLTTPSPSEGGHPNTRPGVIVLNAGLLHRVGPNRTTVALARRLSTEGYAVLRFDFSGIGDSETRRDETTLDRSTVEEAREAMDLLADAAKIDRFVLVGLCEGATNAFRVAHEEPRVVGAVIIDGYAYPTRGFYLREWIHGITRLRRIREYLTGRRDWRSKIRSLVTGGEDAGRLDVEDVDNTLPPHSAVAAQLRNLVARQVALFFIFTEIGMKGYYNYRGQLFDAFPFLRSSEYATVVFMHGADHTFTLLRDQQLLIERIEQWILKTSFAVNSPLASTVARVGN
jgi:pimeloyl-ACP methyl ester carboxylesterase